ncbi:DUF257 family protein [Thermococcus thioreducens]|uniref:Uncharacterized protein n=1 Tax=Thermococcus thioreducens TaxID=277988 RepID=A0A0Q2MRJ8_9EURY|nr:DUF257 family protein [Thermococcus thioreducens]ASJ12861.1 hypothetical protein A3L14_08175 [Thermococcus thioreducens]KQH82327.1 hypothetical protein AMR53_06935 [Thermococcus thioreducens]SEV84182.1 protein of unknown function, DUF257 [Thermococcus thioreducens]
MVTKRSVPEAVESIRNIRPGEAVVVEYASRDPIHLAVSLPLLMAREGMKVVVSDVLDQLHVIRAHLEIMGIPAGWIEDLPVIKFGGTIPVGNVLRRISILKPAPVWSREYEDALASIPGLKMIIMLGIEKMINVRSDLPASTVWRTTGAPSLGAEDRIKVTFVNRDLLEESTLEDIRELATRVFRLEFKDSRLIMEVIKSPNVKKCGKRFSIDADELVGYLQSVSGD